MKVNIGKILKAVGQGAMVAAEFTPQGAMAGNILRRVAVATGDGAGDQDTKPTVPGDLDGDGIPDTVDLRSIAVDAVLEALPTIITRASGPYQLHDMMVQTTDAVHAWLKTEAGKASRQFSTPDKDSK